MGWGGVVVLGGGLLADTLQAKAMESPPDNLDKVIVETQKRS